MAPSDNISLDNIISQITTSNNGAALRHTIRQYPRDILEPILASSLGSGQDPLDVLDSRVNTIGMAYILSARLNVQGAPPPNWNRVLDFCRNFDPESARLVPERMTMLAKGMARYASESIGSKQAIAPLSDLVRRYPPTPSHLTTIHPIFVLVR
ncbi:hypothetical protein BDQ12DRAFT_727800 [Crucibulum laeve]|uniref:COP9 signalosome complex subunit 3 N-terminal helical repeats domain-containing protein n=1 Tax=Crucibulum laeve TaxID=68775 RepID=A0A5C3LL31_9AGAR|nr:hypothetical protein BDQ12DRAFT_727800 [Crucibulum laeve]